MRKFTRTNLFAMALAVAVGWNACEPTPTLGQEEQDADFKTQFLRLCDMACQELNKELTPFKCHEDTDPKTHHVPFFEDGHAIRALAVAYDITGKQEYLDTCKRWSDRMIAYQEKMIPKGAYYLNYFRAPGDPSFRATGDPTMWFISDAGSVGMGVFATAVRCTDANDKARYLGSAESLAKVVMADRIGPNSGIIEKLWGGFSEEWWCSTATFGALAIQLYEETGKEEYRKVGLGALRWMIGRDFRTAKVIGFDERPSGVIFYDFELYVVGMKYLKAGSEERKAAMAQIAEALKWMEENQKGRGGNPSFSYMDKGCGDMSALPFLMYAFAAQLPEYRDLVPEADRELRYIDNLLLKEKNPPISSIFYWENMSWGMMSYAEKLSPGALFRTSKQPPTGVENAK